MMKKTLWAMALVLVMLLACTVHARAYVFEENVSLPDGFVVTRTEFTPDNPESIYIMEGTYAEGAYSFFLVCSDPEYQPKPKGQYMMLIKHEKHNYHFNYGFGTSNMGSETDDSYWKLTEILNKVTDPLDSAIAEAVESWAEETNGQQEDQESMITEDEAMEAALEEAENEGMIMVSFPNGFVVTNIEFTPDNPQSIFLVEGIYANGIESFFLVCSSKEYEPESRGPYMKEFKSEEYDHNYNFGFGTSDMDTETDNKYWSLDWILNEVIDPLDQAIAESVEQWAKETNAPEMPDEDEPTLVTEESGGQQEEEKAAATETAAAKAEAEETAQSEGIRTAVVNTKSDPLSLRRAPNSNSVILKIEKGETVTVLEEGEWPLVEYNGQQGYVNGKYLK